MAKKVRLEDGDEKGKGKGRLDNGGGGGGGANNGRPEEEEGEEADREGEEAEMRSEDDGDDDDDYGRGADGDEDDDEEDDEDDEPDFSDPEDYVDDIRDEDLMPELVSSRPREADGVDAVIVIDGIPVVGQDRLEKLRGVVRKICGKFGRVVNEHYPLDAEGRTKGYAFLEFGAHGSAVEAVRTINNYKLDKQHTFAVNMFSDFDKFLDIPDEWEPPNEEEYKDQVEKKTKKKLLQLPDGTFWVLLSRNKDFFKIHVPFQ